MDTLQGRVTRTRHTTHVTGNGSRTHTRHIAIFQVGGVLVTYDGAEPVLLEHGDHVRVVGHRGEGERTFEAVAYHNLTRDVVGDNVGRPGCAGLVLLLAFADAAGLLGPPLLFGEPAFEIAGEIVPEWLLIVAGVLLMLAILIDRSRAVRRREVLAALEA